MEPTEQKPRRGAGRPPKAPEKGLRRNYAFRMSDQTRDRLQERAVANGRSLSEEVEMCVEKSLHADSINADLNARTRAMLGGDHNLSLFVQLSHYIFFAERAVGKKWSEDAEAEERVLRELQNALPHAMNEARGASLSLSEEIEKREKALADIKSRTDPEEK